MHVCIRACACAHVSVLPGDVPMSIQEAEARHLLLSIPLQPCPSFAPSSLCKAHQGAYSEPDRDKLDAELLKEACFSRSRCASRWPFLSALRRDVSCSWRPGGKPTSEGPGARAGHTALRRSPGGSRHHSLILCELEFLLRAVDIVSSPDGRDNVPLRAYDASCATMPWS